MTDRVKTYVWILEEIEYMQSQHTGFDSSARIRHVFQEKPEMVILSNYLEGLSSNMGTAIGQVHTLLKDGYLDVGEGFSYRLTMWETISGVNL